MIRDSNPEGDIITSAETCYTYKVSENPRDFIDERPKEDTLDWVNKDNHVGQWLIKPFGDHNDLPKDIQRVIQNSSHAPGEIKRKVFLLWGKGPKLYKEELKDNELVRTWVEDSDINAWLKKWNYEKYLLQCANEYMHMESFFSKVHTNKGYTRFGKKPMISKLELSQIDRTRFVTRIGSNSSKATHAIVSDFSFEKITDLMDLSVYELFDEENPFAENTKIHYSNFDTFCQDYYTVPDIYGALEWIRRSNASPLILKALSKNGINPSYHIESPQAFWDGIETKLRQNCRDRNKPYKNQMLKDYEQEILKGISKTLSSDKNHGKFWHSKKTFEVNGTNLIEHGWTITEIPQNVKGYVETQILISDHASKKTNSAIGLNPALGGTGTDTKVNSGGEQHYALQNYLTTQNDVPEMIVCEMMNYALKFNFPDKDLKMGFYHISPKKLQDVTPSERPEAKI